MVVVKWTMGRTDAKQRQVGRRTTTTNFLTDLISVIIKIRMDGIKIPCGKIYSCNAAAAEARNENNMQVNREEIGNDDGFGETRYIKIGIFLLLFDSRLANRHHHGHGSSISSSIKRKMRVSCHVYI